MRMSAHRLVHSRRFEFLLVALILGSAVLQGIGLTLNDEGIGESVRSLDWLLASFAAFWALTLAVLVLEAILKMIALWPGAHLYFRNGWNVFDFLAVSFLIVGIAASLSIVSYGLLILSVRLLRLLRGLSTVQELQLILSTLFRSIPKPGTHYDPDGNSPVLLCSCWI